jgi:hypothetical protein
MENYKKAVKSGFKMIPEAMQIEKLFGEADHFISYSGPGVRQDWNTEVFFRGRYTLTMQVDVKTEPAGAEFSKVTSVVGEPKFFLHEVSKVTLSPSGSVETDFSKEWKFGLNDWKKLVDANGDFSAIGITIKKDQPVENFPKYVDGERSPRIKVRPD